MLFKQNVKMSVNKMMNGIIIKFDLKLIKAFQNKLI